MPRASHKLVWPAPLSPYEQPLEWLIGSGLAAPASAFAVGASNVGEPEFDGDAGVPPVEGAVVVAVAVAVAVPPLPPPASTGPEPLVGPDCDVT